MAWIDFGSGKKRLLDFRGYEVGPTTISTEVFLQKLR
jgi:hypothetical protein